MGSNLRTEFFILKLQQLSRALSTACVSTIRLKSTRKKVLNPSLDKMHTYPSGEGEKSLPCDPRSELRLGGSRTRRAEAINGIRTKNIYWYKIKAPIQNGNNRGNGLVPNLTNAHRHLLIHVISNHLRHTRELTVFAVPVVVPSSTKARDVTLPLDAQKEYNAVSVI